MKKCLLNFENFGHEKKLIDFDQGGKVISFQPTSKRSREGLSAKHKKVFFWPNGGYVAMSSSIYTMVNFRSISGQFQVNFWSILVQC